MNSGKSLEEIKRLFNYLEENKTNNDLQIIMTTECCHDLYKLFIDFNKYQKILEERIKELEEKNKKLKDELELKDFNYTTFRHLEGSNDILKEELKETEEEVDKLEDRIDKAIEYLEHEQFKRTILGFDRDKYLNAIKNKTIEILKGEKNDN